MGGLSRGVLQFKIKFAPAEGMAPIPAASPAPSFSGRTNSFASSLDAADGGRGGGAAGGRRPGGGAPPPDPADDPTLRSVNDKVSLAKAAMQQLQAELAEMTAAGGSSSAPGSSRGAPDTPGGHGLSPLGSDGAAFGLAGPFAPSPRPLASLPQLRPAGGGRGGGGGAAAPASPAHSGLSVGASDLGLGSSGGGGGGRLGSFVGGFGDGDPVVLEDVVLQYSRTAAEQVRRGGGRARGVGLNRGSSGLANVVAAAAAGQTALQQADTAHPAVLPLRPARPPRASRPGA
jgi:hypothetical protein